MQRSRFSPPWLQAAFLSVLLAFCVVAFATPARVAGDDGPVTEILEKVLSEDYSSGNFGAAQTKTSDALGRCIRKGCSPSVKAQAYVILGMVASQTGKPDEAKSNFKNALQSDPAARLPERGQTPNIKNQWAEVSSALAAASAAAAQNSAPLAGAEEEAPGKAPAGWTRVDAFKLATEATAAQEAGRYPECIEKDKASLGLEEQPRTRLHLASCQYRAGKLIDALRDAQKALEVGIQRRDAAVMKVARERVKQLIERIPHITFAPPNGAKELEVTFDGRNVPTESLAKKFSIDPGHHQVVAKGTVNGFPADFAEEYEVKEGELLVVNIKLTASSSVISPQQIECMRRAKTQEEVLQCLPENRKSVVIKMGTDVSVYTDTNSVNVFNPAINASVSSPTSGWNVGGSYLVDVYTAASPDIVSYASPAYKEVRHAGTLFGGYKPGLYGVQGNAAISSEPDYLSLTGGVALTADLNDKLSTPRIAASYTHDTIGKGQTPFDVYSKPFDTWTFEAGFTQVLSPTILVQFGATAQYERGDQSKPYRHVPMFTRAVASKVRAGQSIRVVDLNRLPERPLEQLPTERDRYAFAVRWIQRIGQSATLRLEERMYFDSWSIMSSTTDFRYLMDLSKRIRVWPHGRFNFQSGADFYKRAYTAEVVNGKVTVPLYRTGDREDSPMLTATAGGGARLGLGNLEAETKAGLTLAVDMMYSYFFDSLFVTQRTALYSTLAFDVEF